MHLTYQGQAVFSRSLVSSNDFIINERSVYEQQWGRDRDPYSAVTVAWEWGWRFSVPLRAQFETASSEAPGDAQEQNNRDQLLREITTQVEQVLSDQQMRFYRWFYEYVVQGLETAGNLSAAAQTLSGVKKVIDGFVALGFARSLEQNDFLRALLFGSQRLPDGDVIQAIYTAAIASFDAGQAVPKVEIQAVAHERREALAEVLADILHQIRQRQFTEDHRLVNTILQKINLYKTMASPRTEVPVLGGVRRVIPARVVCLNQTSGQKVVIRKDTKEYDCTAAGLVTHLGESLSIRVDGKIGNISTAVGGNVIGITPRQVVCVNTTRGQRITLPQRTPSWNCQAAGLVVHPGDTIWMQITGFANFR
jgi:hypothetical protein